MTKPRRPDLPRRPWYGPDKMRAAFLAGQGASAREIAAAIGGTNAQRVRAMLRSSGLRLLRQGGNDDVFFIHWSIVDRESLKAVADAAGMEPAETAAAILRKALATPQAVIADLIDEDDYV